MSHLVARPSALLGLIALLVALVFVMSVPGPIDARPGASSRGEEVGANVAKAQQLADAEHRPGTHVSASKARSASRIGDNIARAETSITILVDAGIDRVLGRSSIAADGSEVDYDTTTDSVYNYNSTNIMAWNGSEDVRYKLTTWITQYVNIYHMQNHGSLVKGSGCYGETTLHEYGEYANQNPVWAIYRPSKLGYSAYYDDDPVVWTSAIGAEFQRTSTSSTVYIFGGASSDVCINFG